MKMVTIEIEPTNYVCNKLGLQKVSSIEKVSVIILAYSYFIHTQNSPSKLTSGMHPTFYQRPPTYRT